jgi:ribose transport system substrate-binding protein
MATIMRCRLDAARGSLSALILTTLTLAGGCGGSPSATTGPAATGPAAQPAAPTDSGVFFVGFDASPPLIEALQEGVLHGTVVQNPFKMGQLSVQTLVAQLEKKPIEKQISTGEVLATPQNLESDEVKSVLNPPRLEASDTSSPAASGPKTWRIMVIPKGTTHEHWKAVHAGAVAAANEIGGVEILWKGPQKEDDRTDQIALVDNAAATGVNGIILAPIDAEALVPPVERAIAKGIEVVIIDSRLASDKPAAYVSTDNYHGGQLCGQRMVELLGGKGRVLLLRYAVGSAATEEREKGFLDELAKAPGITIVDDSQYAGGTSDSAQKVAQNLLTRYRGKFDAIHSSNESSTSGTLRALREAGLLKVAK